MTQEWSFWHRMRKFGVQLTQFWSKYGRIRKFGVDYPYNAELECFESLSSGPYKL